MLLLLESMINKNLSFDFDPGAVCVSWRKRGLVPESKESWKCTESQKRKSRARIAKVWGKGEIKKKFCNRGRAEMETNKKMRWKLGWKGTGSEKFGSSFIFSQQGSS